jgi:RNA polymerase sigma factor (sigma-70 family)
VSGAARLPSFEEVYTSHRGAVYALCLSRLRDPADAEDATQDVFARALAHGLADVREMEPWLITMAKNRCVDISRRQAGRRVASEETAVLPDRGDLSADHLVAAGAVVSELLGRLTPAERRVAVHAVIEDKSHREVAAALGIGASTSRVLLSRACRRLRAYLQEHGELLGSLVFGPALGAWRRWRRTWGPRPFTAADRGVALTLPLVIATAVLVGGGPGGGPPAGPLPADSAAMASEPTARLLPGPGPVGATLGSGRAAGSSSGPTFLPRADPSGGLLPPPRQHEVSVLDLAASPSYESDHTLVEVGTVDGCSPPPCYAAFASTDGGRSWTHLGGQGLVSGQLILPHRGFAAGRFFAFGQPGLQVTTDGGDSFVTIAPQVPGFAGSSGSNASQDVVISNVAAEGYNASAAPTLLYSLRPGQQARGPALYLPGRGDALQPAHDAADPSGRVHILACATSCGDVATLPWSSPTELVRSPASASDHTVVAVSSGRDFAVSRDGGGTYATRALPLEASIDDMVIAPTAKGQRLVVLATRPDLAVTVTSDDLGETWQAGTPAGPPPAFRPKLLRWLSGSRLIEAGSEGEPRVATAFRCSNDVGTTWGAC